MIPILLAASLSTLLLAQGRPASKAQPAPTPTEPVAPVMAGPLDEFGPDLKAWLDAIKLQDQDSAGKALASLQRRRAERNLTSVDELAGALSGRAQLKASEGGKADAAAALAAAASFAPDDPAFAVFRAAGQGKSSEAWSALDLATANPLKAGRLRGAFLLGLRVIGLLFAIGFSLALLIRYGAVFSHDVAEGLSGPLKSIALFMAVLFLALPVAGLMGWGYLPFWWVTLFFIFESRVEKAVSVLILVAFGLSSLALPQILHQRSVDAAGSAAALHLVAGGGVSSEGEAIVRAKLTLDPTDVEWSLLSASLSRRAGRFDEASSALNLRAGTDVRFAHNAAALELNKSNFAAALPAFTQAAEGSLSPHDKATALYNLSLAQVNSLAFDQSKDSRKKGDALDAAGLARYDRLFGFDRAGSLLHAPPDIVPRPELIVGAAVPALQFTVENSVSRLLVIALALLLFIPMVVRFRGSQSFSKQCPKCGTTFCWLCQTRSTSQDVCSQCHHLFVVKRGIPPAARAAKNMEISRHVTMRALLHRVASLLAPGAGHLSIGHLTLGLPILLVWAIAMGTLATVHYLAPLLVAADPLGPTLKMGFGALAILTYIVAQVVKPRVPTVAPAPRRTRAEAA